MLQFDEVMKNKYDYSVELRHTLLLMDPEKVLKSFKADIIDFGYALSSYLAPVDRNAKCTFCHISVDCFFFRLTQCLNLKTKQHMLILCTNRNLVETSAEFRLTIWYIILNHEHIFPCHEHNCFKFGFRRYRFHMCFSWWRHQMITFSALLAICAGNSPVTGELPAQRPVTRSFFCLWFATWQTVEQTIVRLVIWDAIAPILTSL